MQYKMRLRKFTTLKYGGTRPANTKQLHHVIISTLTFHITMKKHRNQFRAYSKRTVESKTREIPVTAIHT